MTRTKRITFSFVISVSLLLALIWALNGGLSAHAAPAATKPLADEITVCPAGSPTCNYATIQEAVDAANPGDVIKVAQGTYTDIHVREGITQVVYLSKTVAIRGGYTTTNWTTPYPITQPTTLDAQGQGRGMVITGTITPTIEGLRITGGDATGLGGYAAGDAGGGIYMMGAAPVLSGNMIYSNTIGDGLGAGLYLVNSNAVLNNNVIHNNSGSTYGSLGTVALDQSPAKLNGNLIYSNTVTHGGGLSLRSSDATFNNNVITGNTAVGDGGALQLVGSNPTLNGDIIQGNTAGWGGGLSMENQSDATLVNMVIADNQAIIEGSGLYIKSCSPLLLQTTIARNSGGDGSGLHVTDYGWDYSSVAMTNTIIVSHTVGITVTGSSTATLNTTLWHANTTDWSGNVSSDNDYHQDPGLAADGYHLATGSFAIDRGVNAGVTVDVDGDDRPQGAGFDIGADEFPAGKPDIVWEKQVRVNTGAFQAYGDGPFSVLPGDTVTVVDRVWVTATWDISFTLGEAWSPSLVWDGDGSQATTGTISSLADSVTWSASSVAPNAWHVLTKTWQVTESDQYADTLTETLTVEGLTIQLPERILRFQHARPQPTWEKKVRINSGPFQPWNTGPFTVTAGDVMTVVDRVQITHTTDVSFTLAEDWGTGLDLQAWSNDAGTVTTGTGTLTWKGRDAAPGPWYVLTTTLRIGSGPWLQETLTETLAVEGADPSLSPRRVTLINLGASTGCYARINDSATTYPTVQTAVDAAQPGDLVKVAGICTAVNTYGNLAQVVYLDKSLTIQGGYTTTNWTTPDPAAHPTRLDAQGQGRGIVITGTITPTIEGLRITGGDATGLGALLWGGDAGGGVYVVGATPILSNNVIYSNTASTSGGGLDNGGGVCTLNSDAQFYANTVYSNTAGRFGGGMFLVYGAPILTNNIITGNIAAEYGGGLFLDWSNGTLTGNTIARNKASQRGGGGLFLRQGLATLIENIITDNIAPAGGGVYLEMGSGASEARLRGNTIAANAASNGGGIYMIGGSALLEGDIIFSNSAYLGGGLYLWNSSPIVTNAVVYDNQATGASGKGAGLYLEHAVNARLIHTTIAQNSGGDGSGLHVVGSYPNYSSVALTNTILFSHTVGITVTAGNTATLNTTLWHANTADRSGAGTIDHLNDITGDPVLGPDGYHLGSTSAAIDQGGNAGVTDDIDGQTRPQDSGYDIGADEFVCVGLTGTSITGLTTGTVGTIHAFTATVAPPDASLPVTYTWDPAPAQGSLLLPDGSVASYAWDKVGAYTITLTATNCGGIDTVTHTIHIEPRRLYIYLPLVLRD